MISTSNIHTPERIVYKCDVFGCDSESQPVTRWPSGAYDPAGDGWKSAVAPRRSNTRLRLHLCPVCFAAGKLPNGAENPQPWPLENA